MSTFVKSIRLLKSWLLSKYIRVQRVDKFVNLTSDALAALENEIRVSRQDQYIDGEYYRKKLIRYYVRALETRSSQRVTGYWTLQGIKAYSETALEQRFSNCDPFTWSWGEVNNKQKFTFLDYIQVREATPTGSFQIPSWESVYNEAERIQAFTLHVPQSHLSDSIVFPYTSLFAETYHSILPGELINGELLGDPSQFVVSVDFSALFIAQTSSSSTYYVKDDFTNLEAFADYLRFIRGDEALVDKVYESIQNHINAFKKRLNHFYHAILVSLSRKFRFKQGIGKGREGYIPFRTWARGSLRAWLVNQLVYIDKLSQPNLYTMESTHGC